MVTSVDEKYKFTSCNRPEGEYADRKIVTRLIYNSLNYEVSCVVTADKGLCRLLRMVVEEVDLELNIINAITILDDKTYESNNILKINNLIR